jgi:hypothetical protein
MFGGAAPLAFAMPLHATAALPVVDDVARHEGEQEPRMSVEQLKEYIDYLRAVLWQWLYIREKGTRAIADQKRRAMVYASSRVLPSCFLSPRNSCTLLFFRPFLFLQFTGSLDRSQHHVR